MKIKKGDKVVVIAGKERGKTGVVMRAFPKKNQVLLEDINVVKRHRKAVRGGKGQIIEKPVPIHVSNVQIVDPKTSRGTRIKIDNSKGYTRIAVKSGSALK